MSLPVQDNEKHLSQLPAMHLLQKMQPSWRLLTREEVNRERGGRRANVFLDGILKESLARINRVALRGRSLPFTENGLAEAIERLKGPRPTGLLRVNEELTDLLLLGTAVEQTVDEPHEPSRFGLSTGRDQLKTSSTFARNSRRTRVFE